MMPDITFDHVRRVHRVHMGWTGRLAEFLLSQLSRPQLFMDIDVIRGVWALRSTSLR